jgi:hypothetical protein
MTQDKEAVPERLVLYKFPWIADKGWSFSIVVRRGAKNLKGTSMLGKVTN